jgi:hypothetical protein
VLYVDTPSGRLPEARRFVWSGERLQHLVPGFSAKPFGSVTLARLVCKST